MSDDLNERDLIIRYRQNDEEAQEILLKKYTPIIIHMVNTEIYKGSITGSDREDLFQEGKIALDRAIRDYDPEMHVPLGAFAQKYIYRGIGNYLRSNIRRKASEISLDMYLNEDSNVTLSDIVAAPEKKQPDMNEVISGMEPLEREIIRLKVLGYTYREISEKLSVSVKKVDNTIQKIRRRKRTGYSYPGNNHRSKDLTDLERKVLHLQLAGLSYREISEELRIDKKDVNNALRRIRRKIIRMQDRDS